MPPRLTPDTRPYEFARLVKEGYTYRDACRIIGVSEETARKWRYRLRERAPRLPDGSLVSYHAAVDWALREDEEETLVKTGHITA